MAACPMLITRAHVQQFQQLQEQSSSQRVGALSLLPGYQWAPQWVPARTPTVHWGPISGKAVGGPNTVQHSSAVQKHGKHELLSGKNVPILSISKVKTRFWHTISSLVFHLFCNFLFMCFFVFLLFIFLIFISCFRFISISLSIFGSDQFSCHLFFSKKRGGVEARATHSPIKSRSQVVHPFSGPVSFPCCSSRIAVRQDGRAVLRPIPLSAIEVVWKSEGRSNFEFVLAWSILVCRIVLGALQLDVLLLL